MYIKHLIGARKGEIEDLPFEIAKWKVKEGEAEDVYGQLPVTTREPVSSPVQPVVVSTRADAVTMGDLAESAAHIAKKKARR